MRDTLTAKNISAICAFAILIVLTATLSVACAGLKSVTTGMPAGDIGAYEPKGGAPSPVIDRSAEIEQHILIAENETFELYLKESLLSVIVRDKASGALMRSCVPEPRQGDNENWQGLYLSGVTLDYIQGTNLNTTRADLYFKAHEQEMHYRVDGFSARITFPDVAISFTLDVTLTAYGLQAEIPQSSIVEGNELYCVGDFYVFPFMGYSYLGDTEGYMFVPDGQGALIKLEDNEGRFTRPYSAYAFGNNIGLETAGQTSQGSTFFEGFESRNSAEKILAPVYGMVHTGEGIGFLAIIESGMENAFIEAWPNGASTPFDWIAARFVYRHQFMQPTGKTSGTVQSRTPRANRLDLRVRFAFVAGADADYVGLAGKYRDFLDETGVFAYVKDLDYRTQVDFFGSEKENWVLFKLNVNMTGFKDAAAILRDLSTGGAGSLLSVYTAWQSGGAAGGLPVGKFTPAGNLGGKSGTKALANTAGDVGALVYLQADLFSLNPDAHPLEGLNAMGGITGVTIQKILPGAVYGTMNILTPPRAAQLAESGAQSFAKSGMEGVSLTGITYNLSAFKEDGVYYDRKDNAALYAEAAAAYRGQSDVIADKPFAYLWRYASALVNMPTGGSSYVYTNKEVPFLSIALSGRMPVYAEYTNFQANQDAFFLKLVELGARPAFLVTEADPGDLRETNSNIIYSSRYDLYREQILAYDAAFRALHAQIGTASIVGHETDGSLAAVTYDNGLVIYVNYADEDRTTDDGTVVPAMAFVTKGP